MPGHIADEGEAYVPHALFWLSADRCVLSSAMGREAEVIGEAGLALREAMERPLIGEPSAPARVRVRSAELAAAVRAEHPGLEVRIAATPELDAMEADMRRTMAQDAAAQATYLTEGVQPAAMASLFRAAAALFRAKPWKFVKDDASLFNVTCEALVMHDARLLIVGVSGEAPGFVAFADDDTFNAYLEAMDTSFDGRVPNLALTFEKRREMPPRMMREMDANAWETAGPSATPLLAPTDELGPYPANPDDVHRGEVICRAIVEMMRESETLLAAVAAGEEWSRTVVVPSRRGNVEMTLSTAALSPTEQ